MGRKKTIKSAPTISKAEVLAIIANETDDLGAQELVEKIVEKCGGIDEFASICADALQNGAASMKSKVAGMVADLIKWQTEKRLLEKPSIKNMSTNDIEAALLAFKRLGVNDVE